MALFDFHFDLGQWGIPWFKRKPLVVLVVDDDLTTGQLIRRSAEVARFQLEVAFTAEEALGILHANGRKFIVAMIDVNLPSMDGWELRKRIMESWPRLEIVVMSGAAESFSNMPIGERISVLIKPSNYGDFFRGIKR